MNSSRQSTPIRSLVVIFFALSCGTAAPSLAQTPTTQTPPAEAVVSTQTSEPPATSGAAAEVEAAQKRLSRARSLAAIGKLAAAATELENLRGSTKDESVRDVARVLLMAIFVEMPDYSRAESLLEEAFRARGTGQASDATTHFYFALAGQTVNAVRTHLERYRSFGVNVADASELPPDAAADVDQLRRLLERVVEHARALHAEQLKGSGDGSRGLDAAALLEDAATVRMRIARHDQDRARWQSEISEARQQLFSSEMRIASISEVPAARPTPPPAATAAKTPATVNTTAQPARTEPKGADASQKNAKKTAQPSNEQTNRAANTNTPPPAGPAAAPAAPRAENSPVAVGSLVSKARSRVSPSYPTLARAARVTGNVTVFLVVNEKGEVESVQRADGPMQLQQAAIEAARRWRFNPTVIDGQPVRVTGYLNFNFAL